MSNRAELKKGCEELLDRMIEQGEQELSKIASHGLPADCLARLIAGSRTHTLRAAAIRVMADHAEAILIDRWNDQHELNLED